MSSRLTGCFACLSLGFLVLSVVGPCDAQTKGRDYRSPDGRYVAFVQQTESGQKLRCASTKTGKTFDLAAPGGRSYRICGWSPDGGKLLVCAYTGRPIWNNSMTLVDAPSLFITSPSSKSPKVIWSGSKLKNTYPNARWTQDGRSVVFSLTHEGAYQIPYSLHVIHSDGSRLKTVWEGNFTHFVVSPNGKKALLWLLSDPWFDCPEPYRMGAVDLETGATKLYPEGIVATLYVEEKGKPAQDIRWARDCESVSLLVERAYGPSHDRWRLTLQMPTGYPAPVRRGEVTLLVDGEVLRTSPAPVIRDGRVFVPVTAFRKIGLAVEVEDRNNAWVGWPDSDNIIDFRAGRSWYPSYNAEERIELSGTPFILQGVLMVPLRAMLSDTDTGTSLTAEWDAGARTVEVHRSTSWLSMRLAADEAYKRGSHGVYETPILGTRAGAFPSEMIERARALDSSGKWREAVTELELLISRRPFNWEPKVYRSPAYLREAYPLLGEILTEHQPNEGAGYLYASIGKALHSDHTAALDLFRKGTEVEPENADLHFAVGWAILRQEGAEASFQKSPERLRDARKSYERALEALPYHRLSLLSAAYANMQLAELINRQGGYTDASKAEARPFLEQAEVYFLKIREAHGATPHLDELIGHIRAQLR